MSIFFIRDKLWRPFGPPQLDLLMWKSTVLLRVNLKHVKRKMTAVNNTKV